LLAAWREQFILGWSENFGEKRRIWTNLVKKSISTFYRFGSKISAFKDVRQSSQNDYNSNVQTVAGTWSISADKRSKANEPYDRAISKSAILSKITVRPAFLWKKKTKKMRRSALAPPLVKVVEKVIPSIAKRQRSCFESWWENGFQRSCPATIILGKKKKQGSESNSKSTIKPGIWAIHHIQRKKNVWLQNFYLWQQQANQPIQFGTPQFLGKVEDKKNIFGLLSIFKKLKNIGMVFKEGQWHREREYLDGTRLCNFFLQFFSKLDGCLRYFSMIGITLVTSNWALIWHWCFRLGFCF
jgi:hypothetical protein